MDFFQRSTACFDCVFRSIFFSASDPVDWLTKNCTICRRPCPPLNVPEMAPLTTSYGLSIKYDNVVIIRIGFKFNGFFHIDAKCVRRIYGVLFKIIPRVVVAPERNQFGHSIPNKSE